MSAPVLTGVILEFPSGEVSPIQPYHVRIFDSETGKQIITITELAVHFSAEGFCMVEALFLGGFRENFELTAVRIRSGA